MELRQMIDHTILKPEATLEDIVQLCKEAKENEFKAVCVNPCWIKICSRELENTDVKIATVVGFPLGANTTETKIFETKDAVEKGATEIDMVINVGAIKSKDYVFVENDIKEVVKAAKGNTVKVIIETCLLDKEEIVEACRISKKAGAHFVKTSTGFGSEGAKVEDVKLMKETVGKDMEVKASGGIRDIEKAEEMIKAGATRLGTSSGVQLVKGNKSS